MVDKRELRNDVGKKFSNPAESWFEINLRGIMSFLTKISDKILYMLLSKSESQAQL